MASALPDIVIRASAGTGKTYRLTNRFIQLLALGVPPESILAATFTRKAAGEILDRILRTLALAANDDGERERLAKTVEDSSLTQARCVELLRTLTQRLHRLQVSTLDSFFSRLASSYSLELGLPPGWRIFDELELHRLKGDAIELLLESGSDVELVRLLRLLTKGTTARGVTELLEETVTRCHEIALETDRDAWHRVPCPSLPTDEELKLSRRNLQELIENTDAKTLQKALLADLGLAEQDQWEEMLKKGILANLVYGDTTYYRKELEDEVRRVYEALLAQITAIALHRLARQTEATRELVDCFDREFRQLQRRTGGIGFSDVARALASYRDRVRSSRTSSSGEVDRAWSRLGFRLDARVSHLLLDEFQDTSPLQWQVLRPFAEQILTKQRVTGRGAQRGLFETQEPLPSFFCVGDTKQAIYGWRGGDARIFQWLRNDLPSLNEETLAKSWRSSQPVIDTVNRVFTNLPSHPRLEKLEDSVRAWCREFPEHSTEKRDLPGYAQLYAVREAGDDETQKEVTLQEAARLVAKLASQAPGHSIGVLTRTNDAVARLMFELQTLGVPASEEGGNLLIDSAAVRLILSLLHLADHAGDTVSRFHVAASRLGGRLGLSDFRDEAAAENLASQVRRELLTEGYGPCVARWASYLHDECGPRERSRLEQLIDVAFGFQSSATLRPRDFIETVRSVRIADPSRDVVRVMTIHQAKGLEFDIVVLPQLDEDLLGQAPTIVAGSDSPAEPPNAVCLYRHVNIQQLLPPALRRLFQQDVERRTHEALCVLYVALTRAVHSLHMLIAPSERPPSKTFAGLLRASLTDNADAAPDSVLFEIGNPDWLTRKRLPAQAPKTTRTEASTRPSPGRRIQFAPPLEHPVRGWKRQAPSQHDAGAGRRLAEYLQAPSVVSRERGTLIHKWFEQIEWLDDGLPSTAQLLASAGMLGLCSIQPSALTEQFLRMLSASEVSAALQRGPALVAGSVPQVYRELPFACRIEGTLVSGVIDRLVVWRVEGKVHAAELFDFKTDAISDELAPLRQRTNHYRPQLESYRQAVSRLFEIDAKRVTPRLIFVQIGRVVSLDDQPLS